MPDPKVIVDAPLGLQRRLLEVRRLHAEKMRRVAAEAPPRPRPWHEQARPNQLPPPGDWSIWLILAGRGFGKTKSGAEWIAEQAARTPDTEWAIVAPTWRDCRKTCLEGPSGLLKALLPGEFESANLSELQIRLTNGSRIYGYSADRPDRLRGTNLSGAWVDEAASIGNADDLFGEALMPALRIGENPRVLITTTPRPIKLLKDLLGRNDGSVAVVRGKTWDNAANLSRTALDNLRARYEGTRMGRQELEGELLEDVEGALWSRDTLDRTRVTAHPTMARIVIGVDPAVTSGEKSDSTGIVVAGRSADGHFYILEDATMRGTPQQCMSRAVAAYHRWHADRVIGEVNNGGDYIGTVLRSVDPNVAYSTVRATRGKVVRAEPISALWEQDRGHIVGTLPTLEDQMCVAEGTQVTTSRGDVPIERVVVGDRVLTRVGWRPVTWSGQTGYRPTLTIRTAVGELWCTENHPIFVVGRGFIPAGRVRNGDILVTCPTLQSASASYSTANATTETTTTTSSQAGVAEDACCTGTSGSTTTVVRSHRDTTSTTKTTTGSTTTRPTLKHSVVLSTSVSTDAPAPSPNRLRSRVANAVRSGLARSLNDTRATSAARSFGLPLSRSGSVALSAASATGTAVIPSGSAQSGDCPATVAVYNLTVKDQPEFFANGVLVHNCSYTTDTKESPDNFDAMVWAATELNVGTSALIYLSAISKMCSNPECELPNRKAATLCRGCGAALPEAA